LVISEEPDSKKPNKPSKNTLEGYEYSNGSIV